MVLADRPCSAKLLVFLLVLLIGRNKIRPEYRMKAYQYDDAPGTIFPINAKWLLNFSHQFSGWRSLSGRAKMGHGSKKDL